MVHFVGAGSGAPDLITIRGKNHLETADCIIYAGSLVNKELLSFAKKDCEIHNSAYLNLDEVIDIMKEFNNKGKKIVRLHTGDPALYGAIREQIDILKEEGIEFDITPGVSSLFGAASVIEKEFTLPSISQSLIITRQAGRTPVPERERLSLLAKHRTSMAIFLSAGLVDDVQKELLEGYEENTPVAVVQKATFEDQKIIYTKLKDLSEDVKKADITRTAIIFIGDFLGDKYDMSILYDKSHETMYRKRKDED